MTPARLLRICRRAILVWCLLSGAGFFLVRPLAAALLPAMGWMINHMQSDFRAQLLVEDFKGSPMIMMPCVTTRAIALASGGFAAPDSSFDGGGVDAVHALVPIVIFLVAVISWPVRGWHEMLGRALGSMVLLPPLVAMTTVLLFVGRVEGLLHRLTTGVAPSQRSALLQSYVFMEEGGRWLVPLVAAMLCIGIGAKLFGRGRASSPTGATPEPGLPAP
ncbi:MAG: hypothetical protein P4L83_06215 [Nevskia sp.]|nr:hypothetical protein [Nevskia sp.]